ncbi:hypothetical protein MYAM1_001070 [Malassezia yamatoensis]|uniref:Translational machinery component n=1 Tax=Malassezia yamatoensis TaxID=253288 RepID=A0AAJ5YPY4_9BASI|nr:hypothetical protein MYAM1_001070 [Malassezia yamatoensis]
MLRIREGLRAAMRVPHIPIQRARGINTDNAHASSNANTSKSSETVAMETKVDKQKESKQDTSKPVLEFSLSDFAGEEAVQKPEVVAVPPPRESNAPHRLHVQSTRNNTMVTLTAPTGEPLANASGGTVGFKKAGRSGYEAGYRAAVRIFSRIAENQKRWRINSIEVLWNGFGQGREAVFRAMLANEGEQVRNLVKIMTDKTPIKVGGVRPKKRRML